MAPRILGRECRLRVGLRPGRVPGHPPVRRPCSSRGGRSPGPGPRDRLLVHPRPTRSAPCFRRRAVASRDVRAGHGGSRLRRAGRDGTGSSALGAAGPAAVHAHRAARRRGAGVECPPSRGRGRRGNRAAALRPLHAGAVDRRRDRRPSRSRLRRGHARPPHAVGRQPSGHARVPRDLSGRVRPSAGAPWASPCGSGGSTSSTSSSWC